MPRVTITGSGRSVDAPDGASLLSALQSASEPIATSCGGMATCALCRVTVRAGRENLTAINAREIEHLGTVAKIVGLRLACQARVHGDVAIEIPPVEDVAARKQAKADRLRAQRARR